MKIKSWKKLSPIMRNSAFCLCENNDEDQLHGDCADDQGLCFHFIDSTIPLLLKSENSSVSPSSVICLKLSHRSTNIKAKEYLQVSDSVPLGAVASV